MFRERDGIIIGAILSGYDGQRRIVLFLNKVMRSFGRNY